jgi:hypothetical protein
MLVQKASAAASTQRSKAAAGLLSCENARKMCGNLADANN